MRKQSKNSKLYKSVEEDARFSKISTNPLFHEMPRKEKKVVVDKRFEKLFTDDRFQLGNFKIDKRGRKFGLSNKDHLSNLYDLEKNETEENKETIENEKKVEVENDKIENKESEDSDDDETSENNDFQINLDLARGEGNVSSSSSSDESDLEQEIEEPDQEETDLLKRKLTLNSWGEMDRSVKRVEWASKRIAICNLDWNCLKAEDLFLVLNSFKPENSQIFLVEIYLSDIGAEKINKENINGPEILDDEKDKNLTKEAIRSYELERLRYYYAVCKCDSEDTAIAIYENCDGVEYETSGVRFDIRFIPNDMEFDESRLKERVTLDDLDLDKYKPKLFESFALSNVEAKLTWDETDPERKKMIRKALTEETDFKTYDSLIASGSESETEEQRENRKRLLLSQNATDITNQEELHVEWESTEKEATEKIALKDENHSFINNNTEFKSKTENEKKQNKFSYLNEESTKINFEKKPEKKLTKFQKYLERKKQIRKERKEQEKQLKHKRSEDNEKFNNNDKKRKLDCSDLNDNTIITDNRFSSLFTDSAFAIDKTHPLYKGGDLANRQAQEKALKRQKVIETNKNL